MGRTRSFAVTSSRLVKLSKVTCFSRADSDASLGIPVVPEVSAISTIRPGSAAAVAGVGRPAAEAVASSSAMSESITRAGRAFSVIHRISCSPRPSGSGSRTAPRSGTVSSSATYIHTFGSRTPTTSPTLMPRALSSAWSRRTWPRSSTKVISTPSSQTAAVSPRRSAFDSRKLMGS